MNLIICKDIVFLHVVVKEKYSKDAKQQIDSNVQYHFYVILIKIVF